jgi:membrane protein
MVALKKNISDIWKITKKTTATWWKADPFRQSAIIAYYAIFSIPALLVIVIACAGIAFGREAVQGEISRQVSAAINAETAQQMEKIIAKASEKESSVIAAIISVITLILGATGVFEQLQVSLNQIWEVKASSKKKWLKSIKDRLLSFGIILSIGFLMLVSLLLTSGLTAFGNWIKAHMPDFMLFVFYALNFIVSFGVITVLFALMFKILPDARVRWRDVWIGAIATGLLFLAGKFGLGIYFGKAKPASVYGAAGSIILLMLWVSYSCMIVFFGAEFTKQFAMYYKHKIEPKRGAEMILPNEAEQTVREKREAASNT